MKSRLLELIEKGRQGGNIGLSTGMSKLESYMDSYLPGTSYLIFARSGVGNNIAVYMRNHIKKSGINIGRRLRR